MYGTVVDLCGTVWTWLALGEAFSDLRTAAETIALVVGIPVVWVGLCEARARARREEEARWQRLFSEAEARLLSGSGDEVGTRARRKAALLELVQLGDSDPKGSDGLIWQRCKDRVDTLYAEVKAANGRKSAGQAGMEKMAKVERRRRMGLKGIAALDYEELVGWAHGHFGQQWGYYGWAMTIWLTVDRWAWDVWEWVRRTRH